jgi:hypothetical protein
MKNKLNGYSIFKCNNTGIYKLVETETKIENKKLVVIVNEIVENEYLDVLKQFLTYSEYNNFAEYDNHEILSSDNVWETF